MLETYTDEQLQVELSRRKHQAGAGEKPTQLQLVNMVALRSACQSQLDYIEEHGQHVKDGDAYIYETAMIAVFGSDVFRWINARTA